MENESPWSSQDASNPQRAWTEHDTLAVSEDDTLRLERELDGGSELDFEGDRT